MNRYWPVTHSRAARPDVNCRAEIRRARHRTGKEYFEMEIDRQKARHAGRTPVWRSFGRLWRRHGEPRRQARPLQGDGRRRPAVFARSGARRSGCGERYVREWLNAQVAGGYVDYHAASGTYELSPEQAIALADDTSPVFLPQCLAGGRLDVGRRAESRSTPSRPAAASAGASMTIGCSAASRPSSAIPTAQAWCRNGCRRSNGVEREARRPARRSPMSAAVTAIRPS